MSSHRPERLKSTFRIRLFCWIGAPLVVTVLGYLATLPTTWQDQAWLGLVVCVGAALLGRKKESLAITCALVMLSLEATLRYGYWRVNGVIHYLRSPYTVVDRVNAFVMLVLLAAELYAFIILFLGFLQTIAPLERTPLPMPEDTRLWPTVDVFIPTYNEPLEVVRYSILAALDIDWPADKLNVCVLDDGCRPEFRRFAEEAGVTYIIRAEHKHAKAGNINNALKFTSGEFIAIFDSDHIPTRSFLQLSMGWFMRDPKLGLMQTPHHFYSPDPFEMNLDQFRKIPNEGELFYGIVQDANDLWNATFFCGSCAVISRAALAEVGGIAQETVTEDAHTSLRIQKRGWNTAYINIPQSAGLATESIAGHVTQRVRWARGMMQILRTENPLFAKGLKLSQRLCYFNAMLHFLYALPRLVFLTAPLVYLIFGKLNIPGSWLTILVFAIPHLVLSTMTNSRIQGRKRHSFWNEIYETVLSPFILLPTWLALINPKLGKFNVTAKGNQTDQDRFDPKIASPFLCMLALNVIGLLIAIPRYFYWDPSHGGTILMNVFWTCFNIVILGVTLSVCWDERQRRRAVRIDCEVPVRMHTAHSAVLATTRNLSNGGALVQVVGDFRVGQELGIEFPSRGHRTLLPAQVVAQTGNMVRLEFYTPSLEHQRTLCRILYSPADCWLNWTDNRPDDKPLRSLAAVFAASMRGFGKMIRLVLPRKKPEPQPIRRPAIVPGRGVAVPLAALIALPLAMMAMHPQPAYAAGKPTHPAPLDPTVLSQRSFTFGSIVERPMLLRGEGSGEDVRFSLPSSELVQDARIRLRYTFDREFARASGFFELSLNGAVVGTVVPTSIEMQDGRGMADVTLPAALMVRQNQMLLRLRSHAAETCADANQSKLWALIDPATEVDLKAQRLRIADDLSGLPDLLVEHTANEPAVLSFAFASAPSAPTLQAAGVLASWFGMQTDVNRVRFPASIGTLPSGNVVLMLLQEDQVGGISDSGSDATISLQDNPSDAFGKVLIVHAGNGAAMLQLAQAIATKQLNMVGARSALTDFHLPVQRRPDDAPRWVQGTRASLAQLAGVPSLHGVNSTPMNVYMHLAPDLNFGASNDAYLHLAYETEGGPLGKGSNVAIHLNDASVESVRLDTSDSEQHNASNIQLGGISTGLYASTLRLQFYFVAPDAVGCSPAINQYHGTISGADSYIDLGSVSHFGRLPNLRMFSNAGFPFTRRADLSDTAVLLGSISSPTDITLYLNLLGYFGAQTGYPAISVKVGSIVDAMRFGEKDLLVIGDYSDVAQSPDIASQMPFTYRNGEWSLPIRSSLGLIRPRLMKALFHTDAAILDSEIAASSDGVIEGMESPFTPGRSVVMLLGRDSIALGSMSAALVDQMPKDRINDRITLWQNGELHSYRLSGPNFYVGEPAWYEALTLWLPSSPVLVAILLLCLCTLTAVGMRDWLQYRIRLRLAEGTYALPK